MDCEAGIEKGERYMNNIYIWGAGSYAEYVYSMIDREDCVIQGIVDKDKNKRGMLWKNKLRIGDPAELCNAEYDYVIFSMREFDEAVSMGKKIGIPEDKMIVYWKPNNGVKIFKDKDEEIKRERNRRKIYEDRLDSAPYEWGIKSVPCIESSEKLLKKIKEDGSSLCRFGDGEFEMMRGYVRPWFQEPNEVLKMRLIEVLNSRNPAINLAIAQNYTGFEHYTEDAADGIRRYMSNGTRAAIFGFLDMERVYYDTYVTRPYIIYRNKKNADLLFPLWKKIWEGRSVILVEGKYGRIGVNNDLFDGAKQIRRIVCPAKNAWFVYDQIKNAVKDVAGEEDLICISLGPTATVLAYDLALMGYQAIDIGQIDNEYDWYRLGVRERVPIKGKMVAEACSNDCFETFKDDKYFSQIVSEISMGDSL